MKITASLLPPRPRLAMPLAAGLWSLSAILLLVAAGLLVSGLEMRAERRQLEERLARVNEQTQQSSAGPALPAAAEMNALRNRVRAINALASARGAGSAQILGWLERHMPDNVHLVSFYHKPRDGELLLTAEAPGAEVFTAFLRSLEKEPLFSEVLLSKQAVRSGQSGGGLQFEVRVRMKP